MWTMRVSIGRRVALRLRLLVIGLGIGLLVFLEPAATPRANGSIAQARRDDLAYEGELEKGRQLLQRRRYEEALKSFKRANEMRDKRSPECFLLMGHAYQGLEAYKNVVESCDRAIELGGNDIQLRAQAYNLKGIALQSQSEGKDKKKLQEAEEALREALALNHNLPAAHYNLGFTLMQLGRDQEGIAELQKYVELLPGGANLDQARKMIENPRRARESYAPEFSITTSDGQYIALEDLRGKVVLLDFWGTWCPPCVASVPSLRNLYKRYQKEPSFVMIGISSDSDPEKWREFTAKNQMVWPQYWDRDRRIQRAFAVRAFPTYILIDHEGITRFRSSGTSWERSAHLEEAIRKQLKMATKTAPSG